MRRFGCEHGLEGRRPCGAVRRNGADVDRKEGSAVRFTVAVAGAVSVEWRGQGCAENRLTKSQETWKWAQGKLKQTLDVSWTDRWT